MGAPVQVRNALTGQTRQVSTDTSGWFVFTELVAGTYELNVASQGFKTYELKDIRLSSNERPALGQIRLELGDLSTRVSVEAEMVRLQTHSSERIATVSQSQIADLPLTADRTGSNAFLSALRVLPGVVGTTISGGVGGQLIVTLDCVTNADTGSQGTGGNQGALSPNMDTIGEVKVALATYQAEYGARAGGMVSVVTRAGTRKLSGTAYLYERNEWFNANPWFDNALRTRLKPDGTARRAVYRFHNPGYTIGGPLFIPGTGFNRSRERLFFFWAQEWLKQIPPAATAQLKVPTQAELNGDFSRIRDTNNRAITINDHRAGTNVPFPGNQVPQSLFDPAMRKMLQMLPRCNYPSQAECEAGALDSQFRYNWSETFKDQSPRDTDTLRLDWNVEPRTIAYARFSRSFQSARSVRGTGSVSASNTWPQTGAEYAIQAIGSMATVIHTFAPSLVNESTFGFNSTRQYLYLEQRELDRNDRVKLGLNLPQINPRINPENYVPAVTYGVPGASPTFNADQRFPFRARNIIYNFTNNLSWVRSTHNLKFGLYGEFAIRNAPRESVFSGAFNFTPVAQTTNPLDSNYGFSNALMGIFQSCQESDNRIRSFGRYRQLEWFAQDNWRVNRRVTLDLGGRAAARSTRPLRSMSSTC